MEQYRYWSETNKRYIRIYMVVNEEATHVQLLYENLTEFRLWTMKQWNDAAKTNKVIRGWE